MMEITPEIDVFRISDVMPKADMHVHISLALPEERFLTRVKQKRTTLGSDFLVEREKRYYPDLTQFHETYEGMRYLTSTPTEIMNVTQAYLERIARHGAIYSEISYSFRDEKKFESEIDYIIEGMNRARCNAGIESRIVVTSIRNFGASHAEKAARYLVKHKSPYITGFGLAGDEGADCISEYKQTFHIAWHEAGLGLTPHVGEQYLHNVVNFLDTVPKDALDINQADVRRLRVGHGTMVHMSDYLMDMFKEHAICMETCLSAKNRIGLPMETLRMREGDVIKSKAGHDITIDRYARDCFGNIAAHPFTDFIAHGIPNCLGSDNPLLMNTNIGKEYSLSKKAGADTKMALDFTKAAVAFANLDSMTRAKLNHLITDYEGKCARNENIQATALGYIPSYDC